MIAPARKYVKLTIVSMIIILCIIIGYAKQDYYNNNPLCRAYDINTTNTLQYMVNINLGTHRQAIGVDGYYFKYFNFRPSQIFPTAPQLYLTLYSRLGYMYNYKYFGIPGASHSGEAKVGFILSAGESNNFYKKYFNVNEPGKHNLSLYWSGFLTTDKTSQLIGGLYYSYIHKKNMFGFEYNNDTFTPYPADRYRTAAASVFYYRDTGNFLIGFDFGFKLWTGQRKFNFWDGEKVVWPEEVDRDKTATMYYGKEYSHGIAFISFVLNEFSLSFGYDSEKIRDFIQNRTHYVLNDARVPLVARKDRFFIEFKMFDFGTLY